jgi:uncharacterized protein (DUF1330 family)
MIYMVTSLFDLVDVERYTRYGVRAKAQVERHGGKFLLSSHDRFAVTAMEGPEPDVVNIAIFPNKDAYLAFYNSPEYQKLKQDRTSFCRSQITMLERK